MGQNHIFLKMTYRQMVKNKVRTLVTIIGIMLSAALITAITVFIASLHKSMLDYKIKESGNWYGVIEQVDLKEGLEKIRQDSDILSERLMYNIGSTIEEQDGHQISVKAFSDENEISLPLELTEGRMAENSKEIVVARDLITSGILADCKVGDTIEPALADTQRYTVVGLYEDAGFNVGSTSSYVVYTKYDEKNVESADVYIQVKNPKNTYAVLKRYSAASYETGYNLGLLRLSGISVYSSYYSFITTIAVIVIVLVVGASVLLIYNSFVISLNERTKQFGLLSSVGATKAQLRKCVLSEAFLVSIAGIPLGILVGVAGIGITLFGVRASMKSIAASMVSLGEMKLYPAPAAIAAAAVVSLFTVLISTFIPMIRISRMSAIEAIRQNGDIQLSRRKIRCSKIFRKLFGVEGVISRKNFKRSGKRYRTTIFSLFVSIVMFVSASAFGKYLVLMVEENYKLGEYDVYYRSGSLEDIEKEEPVIEKLKQVQGVKESSTTLSAGLFWYKADENSAYLTEEYKTEQKKSENASVSYNDGKTLMFVYGIADDLYERYLQQNGLSKDTYMNTENPVYLLYTNRRVTDTKTGKRKDYPVFANQAFTLKACFYPETEDENEQEEKQAADIDFNIGRTVDKLPYAVQTDLRYQNDIVLCSRTMAEKLTQKMQYRQGGLITYFKTTDHMAVYEQMQKILKDNGQYFRYSLVDEAMEYESYRSIIYVVKVFSYGFLVLMSLIAMANVFNTISTNMMLRRREFAMLKSIGMTEQGFGKMLYFECLMYGSKALLYGIPVSVLISVWIAKTINNVQVLVLDIPWMAILISVLSVYFIVFVTMIYSKKKLQKLNLIGCIKEENI
jgi:putative ABC transport system permease protein